MRNEISTFFDEFSDSYEDKIFNKSLGTKFCSKIELDFINKNLNICEKDKILDVGVGTGRISSLLIKKHVKLTAIEFSEEMIKKAKQNLYKYPIRFVKHDISYRLPFKDNSFDSIVCIRVIKYVPKWKFVLENFERVLKTNGKLVIEIPNKISVAYFGKNNTKYFLFNYFDFSKELKKSGFKIKKLGAGLRIPFPIYVKVDNKIVLKILNVLENIMNILFPKWFLSRNLMVYCEKSRKENL